MLPPSSQATSRLSGRFALSVWLLLSCRRLWQAGRFCGGTGLELLREALEVVERNFSNWELEVQAAGGLESEFLLLEIVHGEWTKVSK
jgi:hypothetical protein